MAFTDSGARQYPQALFWIAWIADPAEDIRIERTKPNNVVLADVKAGVEVFVDNIPGLGDDEEVEWTLTGLTSTTAATVSLIANPSPYTYGEPDALVSTIRYADIEKVKRRIGVEDTTWDAEITQACISAETAMDLWWGRSFPDDGINPRWPGIPVQVSQAAENIAVAVLKQTDAPFGIAGSDSMMGELDIDDTVRRELHRSPLLRSFKVSQGMGLAR